MAQSQYATSAQLSSLALTPAATSRFGATAIEAQLQAASSICDSYIASQFTLPLITEPQGWDMSLVMATCNIAAYLLYCQYGFNPAAPADKYIQDRYQAAIAWLEQIRDKLIFPTWTDSTGDTPAFVEAGPYIESDPPVGFTDRGIVTAASWVPGTGVPGWSGES